MAAKRPERRPDPETLAMVERLERIRTDRGLTREEFELAAGIPSGAYSRWSKGQRLGNLTIRMGARIAKRLGISPGLLLFGEHPPATAAAGGTAGSEDDLPPSQKRPTSRTP